MVPTYDFDDQSPPINSPNTADLTLGVNESNLEVDFGYNGGAEGRIGDRIWFDANSDGVQDDPAQEPGIASALIRIDGNVGGNPYVNFDFTDQNGNYLFTNLPFLTYTVTVVATPYGLPPRPTILTGCLTIRAQPLSQSTKPRIWIWISVTSAAAGSATGSGTILTPMAASMSESLVSLELR